MNWDKEAAEEWKELGFYYQLDKDLKQWWLMGSRSGLENFTEALLKYSTSTANSGISEHIHLGPHQYLKIMTWHSPLINNDCIGGSLPDIKRLKDIIADHLLNREPGETFEIGTDYAPESEYIIKFFVMANGFNPSSIEFPHYKN